MTLGTGHQKESDGYVNDDAYMGVLDMGVV